MVRMTAANNPVSGVIARLRLQQHNFRLSENCFTCSRVKRSKYSYSCKYSIEPERPMSFIQACRYVCNRHK